MTLLYSREAKEKIRVLPPEMKKTVKSALDDLSENRRSGKALQRELTGFWSLRIGRHRIIYRFAGEKQILVYTLGRRERIYEDLAKEAERKR